MLARHQAAGDEFSRLHRAFTFHLGVATSLAWAVSLYAATAAPWVRNIRPLLDGNDLGRIESTGAFLFAMPAILAVFWVVTLTGREMLRHFMVLRSQAVEFALAGAAAFTVFYMAVDRAVAALLIAS